MELMTYEMAGTAAELEQPLMMASPDDDTTDKETDLDTDDYEYDNDNENGIEDEDDLHEIQVDDDLEEPGEDWKDEDGEFDDYELVEEEDEEATKD